MVSLIIIQILIFVLASAFHAYAMDRKQRLIKRGWQKTVLGIYELILFLVLGIVICLNREGEWLSLVISLILFMPIRWIIHDLTLNIMRGKSWFGYYGEESYTDGLQMWWEDKTGMPGILLKVEFLGIALFIIDLIIQ